MKPCAVGHVMDHVVPPRDKHCAGLWGTFDSGNRYGVSAKRPKNRPPDNSTESKKRKPISLVTVEAS
jgi:hypothetical protein